MSLRKQASRRPVSESGDARKLLSPSTSVHAATVCVTSGPSASCGVRRVTLMAWLIRKRTPSVTGMCAAVRPIQA